MILRKNRLTLGTAIAGLAMLSAPALADDYDWSGVYLGGTFGAMKSETDSKVRYDTFYSGVTDSATASGYWSDDGAFIGSVYNGLNDSDATTDGSTDGPSSSIDDTASIALGDPANWISSDLLKATDLSGTALFGAQYQAGNLVLGIEGRGTFGNFGTKHSSSTVSTLSNADTAVCIDSEGCTADVSLPGWVFTGNYDNVDGDGVNSGDDLSIDAHFSQSTSLNYSASYSSVFSPVARLGVAQGRFMVFAMGGPTIAKVTARTSATASESGDVDVVNETNSNSAHIYGEADYSWAGSNTETLYGYTVGGGFEFAATENVIFRFEGNYSDLGDIRVTGSSDDTTADYTVSQRLKSYSMNSGIIIKF